ncbi:hypothetical protein [Roseateles sp. YR242]|uniref:hypothetical protein n=1 Tax=Roseateles sp. YR242 TaxID=1855305 RepID=UPI001C4331CB|nr:hypothetical protein [Roseateles sp. YR242]
MPSDAVLPTGPLQPLTHQPLTLQAARAGGAGHPVSTSTAPQATPPGDPWADLSKLSGFISALRSGQPLSSHHVLSVVSLLTLPSAWPPNVWVRYIDDSHQPPIRNRLPNTRVPSGQQVLLPVEIERQGDGVLYVGHHEMCRDLRRAVAPSEWASFDAMLTGIRQLLPDPRASQALGALLASTGVIPGQIYRELDAEGLPTGQYREALQAIRKKALEALTGMVNLATQRVSQSTR